MLLRMLTSNSRNHAAPSHRNVSSQAEASVIIPFIVDDVEEERVHRLFPTVIPIARSTRPPQLITTKLRDSITIYLRQTSHTIRQRLIQEVHIINTIRNDERRERTLRKDRKAPSPQRRLPHSLRVRSGVCSATYTKQSCLPPPSPKPDIRSSSALNTSLVQISNQPNPSPSLHPAKSILQLSASQPVVLPPQFNWSKEQKTSNPQRI